MLSSVEWNQLVALRNEVSYLNIAQETKNYYNDNEKTVIKEYLNRRIENLEEKQKLRR